MMRSSKQWSTAHTLMGGTIIRIWRNNLSHFVLYRAFVSCTTDREEIKSTSTRLQVPEKSSRETRFTRRYPISLAMSVKNHNSTLLVPNMAIIIQILLVQPLSLTPF